MAMKVEVSVADILRSFTSGVISERIAIRKLEKLMEFQYQLGYVKGVAAERHMNKPVVMGVDMASGPDLTAVDGQLIHTQYPQEHVGGAPGQKNSFTPEELRVIHTDNL